MLFILFQPRIAKLNILERSDNDERYAKLQNQEDIKKEISWLCFQGEDREIFSWGEYKYIYRFAQATAREIQSNSLEDRSGGRRNN